MSTGRARRDRRGERGYAAVLTAVFVAFVMLPCCAIAIDVARMYLEIQRVQNAADAAALAAVTYLPDDFNAAATTARAVSGKNGYPDTDPIDVAVTLGAKPTQLKVTVTSTIRNSFAAAFGMDFATVKRSAMADYNGPAPMGSPCNSFGNQLQPGAKETTDSSTPSTSTASGGAQCLSTPNFWAAIAGPDAPKSEGDAVMSRRCGSVANSGCSQSGSIVQNDEFDPNGYFYAVRVREAAVGQPVTLQIFDPASVAVGNNCQTEREDANKTKYTVLLPEEIDPSATNFDNDMNPYTKDGKARYVGGNSAWCTGDTGSSNLVTSFGLRSPVETYRPTDGAPVSGCIKQFTSYSASSATSKTLRERKVDGSSNSSSYKSEVAQVFRQWVDLCTFTPSRAGDYYLQVRTNVALGGTGSGAIRSGNEAVLEQKIDAPTVKGTGNNRFALRAVGPSKQSVSIAGWEEMGIYANFNAGPTTFNLVRVIPAAATKTLIITFFDVGDADAAGSIQVLPPLDSKTPSTPPSNCTGGGVVSGPLTDCKLPKVGPGSGYTWDGRAQTIRVPVPSTYECTSNEPGGCWYRLRVNYPSGVRDTTTWSARVEGDPVRLIE